MNTIHPKEFKVMSLRDCPVPESMLICETPDHAASYWQMHIATHSYFNPECECFVVLLLNTRKRIKGHQLVTIGTMDMHQRHLTLPLRSEIWSSKELHATLNYRA
jgi:hypothetical protein